MDCVRVLGSNRGESALSLPASLVNGPVWRVSNARLDLLHLYAARLRLAVTGSNRARLSESSGCFISREVMPFLSMWGESGEYECWALLNQSESFIWQEAPAWVHQEQGMLK